ncbi:ABC transporter family substrate-binding protein [Zafaria sp. Z1313]|uniref:ABC transporter family substrate-binding protein n=1 Tax=unclassified Zafaria TaxID=2828765 RepID=UPI002E78CDDC|nr:ABC transporter family substrate-binding protein [Zafaria sp. J156]MEE1620053.1 ABC transporter family substrate-binding protein [Zafaria sp. J156]
MNNHIKVGAALSAALLLTACAGGGNGSGGPASAAAGVSGDDLAQLVDINEQPREALADGGTLTLPVGNVGPNFNRHTNAGNSADNAFLLSPMNQAGCWTGDAVGTPQLKEDFCTEFESDVVDGVQTITIKINEQAAWNDGTPIEADSFINTWKQLDGSIEDNDIVSPGSYEYIESVEQGETAKDVTVVMKTPTFPVDALFYRLVHPDVNTPEVFNDGFVGEPHPEWRAGPYTLDQYDSAAQTISYKKNDAWWGEPGKLDTIVFRQMEDSATIAAFKNGEIDATAANTLNRYQQLDGTPDADVRRGQRLFAGGMNINAQADVVSDVAVREAIFTAVDRKALAAVRYSGLNWEEETPGSMMLLPVSPHYQDNYPVEEPGAEAAKQVLVDAGYEEGADGVMAKDGEKVAFSITNFGDDPTTLALVQTLQDQLNKAGMEVSIDQRGSSDFGKVMGERTFQMTISGYTVGSDPTNTVKQFYDTKVSANGVGDEELDRRIAEVPQIEDDTERIKAAMDIEKEHMAKYYSMGIAFNGPLITFAKQKLANYGSPLFKGSEDLDWTLVGWESE